MKMPQLTSIIRQSVQYRLLQFSVLGQLSKILELRVTLEYVVHKYMCDTTEPQPASLYLMRIKDEVWQKQNGKYEKINTI